MTRKFIRAVAAILAVLCMAAAVSSCGDTTTEPASPSSSVSKKTESTETPGADGKIFEIQSSEDMTVEVEGNTYNIYVPNEQTVLQLHKYVKVGRGISWRLADDVSMKSDSLIPSKTVSLKEGVNIFYVNCQNETESVMEDYTIIIHRAGMYTVRFEGLTETQSVLEGGYAKAPAGIPKKEGYNFESWDFDFSKRITADTEYLGKMGSCRLYGYIRCKSGHRFSGNPVGDLRRIGHAGGARERRVHLCRLEDQKQRSGGSGIGRSLDLNFRCDPGGTLGEPGLYRDL